MLKTAAIQRLTPLQFYARQHCQLFEGAEDTWWKSVVDRVEPDAPPSPSGVLYKRRVELGRAAFREGVDDEGNSIWELQYSECGLIANAHEGAR